MGFMRLKVGDGGRILFSPIFWKHVHWPESVVDVSDSSHSGMVAGNLWRPRAGLDGAEAKSGMLLRAEMDSMLKGSLGALVGEEIGGVTGALFDILRGGREEDGMELRRNANGWDDIIASPPRVGLGQEEDNGLGW